MSHLLSNRFLSILNSGARELQSSYVGFGILFAGGLGMRQKGHREGNHRGSELDISRARFKIFASVMRAFKQNRTIRGLILVFAAVFLSGSFAAAYRHLIFTGVAKYITHDHELRRVLGRAERDNLRMGLIVREQGSMPDQEQIGEVPSSPQLSITYYRISFLQHSLIDHSRLINDLSPVLNL